MTFKELNSIASTAEGTAFSYAQSVDLQSMFISRNFLLAEASSELHSLQSAVSELSRQDDSLSTFNESLRTVLLEIDSFDTHNARSLLTASFVARKEFKQLLKHTQDLPESVKQTGDLLDNIIEQTSVLKANSDLPLLTADGLNRSHLG